MAWCSDVYIDRRHLYYESLVGATFVESDTLLIDSVNIKGLLAPNVTIDTVRQLKVYNDKLVTTRRAWGALAITSDGLIMLVRKSFQLHRYIESRADIKSCTTLSAQGRVSFTKNKESITSLSCSPSKPCKLTLPHDSTDQQASTPRLHHPPCCYCQPERITDWYVLTIYGLARADG